MTKKKPPSVIHLGARWWVFPKQTNSKEKKASNNTEINANKREQNENIFTYCWQEGNSFASPQCYSMYSTCEDTLLTTLPLLFPYVSTKVRKSMNILHVSDFVSLSILCRPSVCPEPDSMPKLENVQQMMSLSQLLPIVWLGKLPETTFRHY